MTEKPSQTDNLAALVGQFRSAASPLRTILKDVHQRHQSAGEGKVADYIPELSRADPDWFGVSVVTAGGEAFAFGQADQTFTIQSISKPFVYGLALEMHGRDAVLARIGVEPTGDAFNSIVKLDEKSKRPHNPMVNAGAIAAANLIRDVDAPARLNRMLDMFRRYVGHDVMIDMGVFTSERATGHRNRAIAHLMRNFSMIGDDIEDTLDLYFKQCSVLVSCRDLAVMAATLANDGVNPLTGERAVEARYIRDVLSVMQTCGMYDFAGEWVYRVGMPAKSGVAGGIIGVVPGKAGIAVFSPPLDEHGNSVRGIKVFIDLAEQFGLHLFEPRGRAGEFEAALSARRPAAAAASPAAPTAAPSAAEKDLRAELTALRQKAEAERQRVENLVKAVIPIGVALMQETNFDRLLEAILVEAKSLCNADGGTLYLRSAEETLEFVILRNDSLGVALGGSSEQPILFPPLQLRDTAGNPNLSNVATWAAITGNSMSIADAYCAEGFEFSGTRAFDESTGYRSTSFLTVPLKSKDRVIGVLQLINAVDRSTGAVVPFDPALQPIIESLSLLAAAALEAYLREERLRAEIRELHIQVDDGKRARQVAEITETDYFQMLQSKARALRERS